MRAIACLAVVCAAAATSTGCWSPSVHTSYDRDADFRDLTHYSIVPNKQELIAIRMLDGQPMAKTIEQSIADALNARGCSPAASAEQAQMLVHWIGNIEYSDPGRASSGHSIDPEMREMDSGVPGYGGGGAAPVAESNDAGSIVIGIYDTKTKRRVWQGTISAGINEQLPDPQRVKRLNTALTKLFAEFPPKT
jgi:hypothetical protein